MTSYALRLTGLAIVASLLSGCGAVGSSAGCLPVVDYDQPTLDRAADEVEALPADAVLPGMLSDYAVLRAQVRAGCR